MNSCANSRNCCQAPMPDCYGDYPVAMAYVPWQQFTNVYDPDKALCIGTIFPELNLPYTGKETVRR